MGEDKRAEALAQDADLQVLMCMRETCTDTDHSRVLDTLYDVMINKHKHYLLHGARLNINEANNSTLERHFSITKKQAADFVKARKNTDSPFTSIHDLEPELQSILMRPENKYRFKFDGELCTPAITSGARTLTELRDIYAQMLFVLKLGNEKDLAPRPSIQEGSGHLKIFTGGMDFTAKPNSRARYNFSRPVYREGKSTPLWFIPCWVHVFKRYRCAIANGRLACAPAEQAKHYQAYAKVIMKDGQKHLTLDQLNGENTMSVPIAVMMFSSIMVDRLREEGFHETADFADHLRMFYDSCNDRGTIMEEREEVWKRVYEWLISMADIFEVGEYVNGIPLTTWESSLTFLSSMLQICAYLKERLPETYRKFNVRSVNNDPIENFFGCLGYHTKAANLIRYHDVKIEYEKKIRIGLMFRYPLSSRKNTLADTKPFNDPNIASKKRSCTGELIVQGKRFKPNNETDGPARHAKALRDRIGEKVCNRNKVDDPSSVIMIDD